MGDRGAQGNEGPVGFVRGGKTFISSSASAYWDNSYAVGLLTNTAGNMLDAAAWKKTGGGTGDDMGKVERQVGSCG